jgi:hypothetical protein
MAATALTRTNGSGSPSSVRNSAWTRSVTPSERARAAVRVSGRSERGALTGGEAESSGSVVGSGEGVGGSRRDRPGVLRFGAVEVVPAAAREAELRVLVRAAANNTIAPTITAMFSKARNQASSGLIRAFATGVSRAIPAIAGIAAPRMKRCAGGSDPSDPPAPPSAPRPSSDPMRVIAPTRPQRTTHRRTRCHPQAASCKEIPSTDVRRDEEPHGSSDLVISAIPPRTRAISADPPDHHARESVASGSRPAIRRRGTSGTHLGPKPNRQLG